MTISDERLAEMALKASLSPHTRDEAAAYHELQSLRAIPRGVVSITPGMKAKAAELLTRYGISSGAGDLGHDLLQQVLALSSIEQEQEPVAWQRVAPDGTIEITRSRSTAAGWDRSENFVRGLYASPSVCQGKVTEEMVERMAVWMAADHAKDEKDYDWAATDNLWKTAWRKKARAALTAALSQEGV